MDLSANPVLAQNEQDSNALRRPYVAPTIRVMDEKEVLSSFQVTVAAISWWVA